MSGIDPRWATYRWISWNPADPPLRENIFKIFLCAILQAPGGKAKRSWEKGSNERCGRWRTQVIGYLRYDTEEELECLNDLYRNELRLYKNFFQPVNKLERKERVGGHITKENTTGLKLLTGDCWNQIRLPKKKKRTSSYCISR